LNHAEFQRGPCSIYGDTSTARGSDLKIVFGAPRGWPAALAPCFPLNLFEFLAYLIEPMLKFSSFDFDTDLAPGTDDM